MTNEAAERLPFGDAATKLHDRLGHSLARGVRIGMIEETLAAERKATVERIRAALDAEGWRQDIDAILDAEAAR